MQQQILLWAPVKNIYFLYGNSEYTSAGGDAYGDDRLNNFGVNVGFQVHLGK